LKFVELFNTKVKGYPAHGTMFAGGKRLSPTESKMRPAFALASFTVSSPTPDSTDFIYNKNNQKLFPYNALLY